MVEFDREQFEFLGKALVDCVITAKTVQGLKVGLPKRVADQQEIEMACVQALQYLTGYYGRPAGLKFISMGQDDQYISF